MALSNGAAGAQKRSENANSTSTVETRARRGERDAGATWARLDPVGALSPTLRRSDQNGGLDPIAFHGVMASRSNPLETSTTHASAGHEPRDSAPQDRRRPGGRCRCFVRLEVSAHVFGRCLHASEQNPTARCGRCRSRRSLCEAVRSHLREQAETGAHVVPRASMLARVVRDAAHLGRSVPCDPRGAMALRTGLGAAIA